MLKNHLLGFRVDHLFAMDLEKLAKQLNLTKSELLREAIDRMREDYLGIEPDRDLVIVAKMAFGWLVQEAEAKYNPAQKKQLREIIKAYTRKGNPKSDKELIITEKS